MSKRRKRRRPTGAPAKAPARSAGPRDAPLVVATRIVCLVGLPALLLLSPTMSYMRPAGLYSENSLFQWNCVEALAVLVGAIWLAAVALGQVPRIRIHKVDLAIIAFFLVSLVSSMLAAYHFDASRRLKEMVAGVVFYIVVKNVFDGERQQRTLIRVFMGMLGLLAVIGVVHYLYYVLDIRVWTAQGELMPFLGANLDPNMAAWETDFGVRATSIDGNPNFLAANLLVLLPIGLAWLVMHKRPRIPVGPVVGTIAWVLIAAILLGATAGASKAAVTSQQKLQSIADTGAPSVRDKQDAQRQLKSSIESARTRAKWTIAWTTVGVIGFVVILLLWPFYGTAVAVVLGFLLLACTNSWPGFSGFLVGLGLFALLVYLRKPAQFRPRTARALGGAFVVMLLGFMLIKYLAGSYIIPPAKERTGGRSRLILYDAAPRMIRARPLLGFGADSFFAYSNKYIAQIQPGPSRYEPTLVLNPAALLPVPGQAEPARITLFPEENAPEGTVSLLGKGRRLVTERHALVFINNPGFIRRNPGRVHNEYLAVLIETGVIGFAVFVAIFVLFYTGTLEAWRRGEGGWKVVVLLGSTAAVTALVVMQTVDFPLRLPWTTCLVMSAIALAATYHRGWTIDVRLKLPLAVRLVPVAVLAAACVYLLATDLRQVRTLQMSKAAIREYETQGMGIPTEAVLDKYKEMAARRARDHNIYFQLPEIALYLDHLDNETVQALQRLAQIQPYHEKVHYLWGQYYRKLWAQDHSKTGDLDRAVAEYRRALELEPRMLKARLFLIDCLIKAGRLDDAKAAVAETRPWEVESNVRIEMASPGNTRVKRVAGAALIQPEDLYWTWVTSDEATLLALDGDFEGAKQKWQEAGQRALGERSALVPFDQGAFGLFPDPPIFVLNEAKLAATTPGAVRANQAAWARRFIGVADYERFKRLEDEYAATLRRGRTVLDTGEATIKQDAVRRAEVVLDQVVAEFGAASLTTGGNWGREYHNRRGFLLVTLGQRPEALKEFQLSADQLALGPPESHSPGASLRTDVARANILATTLLMQGGTPLPIIEETQFDAIRFARPTAPWNLLVSSPTLPREIAMTIIGLSNNYPHYVPATMRAVVVLHRMGQDDEARRRLDLLQRWYPDDDRPAQLRTELGL
jgi:tetratricopeptide (TPR) repeat protein